MNSITEAAKEILDANVKAKQASMDPMPKVKAHVTDVGRAPVKQDDELPDELKGVPSATPPGKVGNPKKDEFGVGKDKPKDAKTIADTDVKQYDDTDLDSWVNGSPANLPTQTFAPNSGAINMSGKVDLTSLFKGESVSPEFIESASTLFEAAVNDKVNEIVSQIEEEMNEQFEQAINEAYEELFEQTDAYINNFVNEWIVENQPVLEANIRSQLAEQFMGKVAELFEEYNVDINEENVDIVEGLSEQNVKLQDELAEAHKLNDELVGKLEEIAMSDIVSEACGGLTQVQAEKLMTLSENITFNDIDDFADKVNTIKESYIKDGTSDVIRTSSEQMLTEDASYIHEENAVTDPFMAKVVKALEY